MDKNSDQTKRKSRSTEAELQAKLEARDAENAELRKRLSSKVAKTKGKGKGKVSEKVGEEMKNHIKDVIIRRGIWSRYKFLPRKRENILGFGGQVHDGLVKSRVLEGASTREDRDEWVDEHWAEIATEFNKHRTYVVSIFKRAVRKCYDVDKDSLPSAEDIDRCVKRKLDLTNPKDLELFRFYWNNVLPSIPGNNVDWTEDKRFFGTISTAAPEGSPKKKYMTASNEAWASVMYHNYVECWKHQWAAKAKPEHARLNIQLHKPPQHVEIDAQAGHFAYQKNLYLWDKKYKQKWSNNDAGSSKCGGWDQEGIDHFRNMVAYSEIVRKKKKTRAMEEDYLAKLREENGIYGASMEEFRREKKKKKHPLGDHDEEKEENADAGFNDKVDVADLSVSEGEEVESADEEEDREENKEEEEIPQQEAAV